jgi:hypothetical protein
MASLPPVALNRDPGTPAEGQLAPIIHRLRMLAEEWQATIGRMAAAVSRDRAADHRRRPPLGRPPPISPMRFERSAAAQAEAEMAQKLAAVRYSRTSLCLRRSTPLTDPR